MERLVACFLSWRDGLNSRRVYVGILIDEVILWHGFLSVFLFSHANYNFDRLSVLPQRKNKLSTILAFTWKEFKKIREKTVQFERVTYGREESSCCLCGFESRISCGLWNMNGKVHGTSHKAFAWRDQGKLRSCQRLSSREPNLQLLISTGSVNSCTAISGVSY
jgi:hypothetical protein